MNASFDYHCVPSLADANAQQRLAEAPISAFVP